MIVSIAEEMNAKRRCTMEDCVVVYGPDFFQSRQRHKAPPAAGKKRIRDDTVSSSNRDNSEWNLFGVYDGHGGREIVEFLDYALGPIIAQELFAPDDDASILQRLERSFLLADVISFQRGIKTSGATVVTCLIRHYDARAMAADIAEDQGSAVANKRPANNVSRNSRKRHATIYTANCGDARSVLSLHGRIIRLSHDHKADDPVEVERIERAGGFVVRGRVLGILAVARSLGDHLMKEYVIAKPYLSEYEVEYKEDTDQEGTTYGYGVRPFVILACDGLWDVVSDEDAVQLVKSYVASYVQYDRQMQMKYIQTGAAQVLVDAAM